MLSAVAALAFAAPAFAADLPVKAPKIVAAPSPWDVAFGVAFTSDYVLRGVSQSNHRPAVQAYSELDYTVNDRLKFYAGIWGSSLWTGFADAEFDITGGARLTFNNFGLDLGLIYYYYPGGNVAAAANPLSTGNWLEWYAKPTYKFNDYLTVGGVFESAFGNFNNKVLNPGPWVGNAGHYYASVNAVITLPWQPAPGVTVSINPEYGFEWYSAGVTTNLGFVNDRYWDIGLDFAYKAMTLDLRYWGTSAKPGVQGTATANQCNTAAASGFNSNLCGDRFVATLKFDTTLAALK